MKSALVVIDVQEYFLREGNRNLPHKISEFIGKNRSRFDYLVFFRFQNVPGSNWYKVLGWEKMTDEKETELAEEFNRFSGEGYVFTKKGAFSVFRSDEFIKFLDRNKVTGLYMCGMDTHACVQSSVMEAFERGYDVKVIEDLCASYHGREYHDNAVKSMKRNLSGKTVMNTKDYK